MTVLHRPKLLLPIVFFGYAILANISLLAGGVGQWKSGAFLKGEVTHALDMLYRKELPHRPFAVASVGALRYLLLNQGRAGVVPGRAGWLFTAEEFRTKDTKVAVAQAVDIIHDIREDLAELGTELLVLPVPAKIDIARSQARHPQVSARQAELYRDFLEKLHAHDIATIDTRAALLAQAHPFFATDTHWTSEGATAVAQAVAASGKLGQGDMRFQVVPGQVTAFRGDLVSFVTSDFLAARIGLQAERVIPFRAVPVSKTVANGIDLFATTGPPPVALVGTSYSANPNWSFTPALQLALRRDVLNHAAEGQGPLRPMRDFIAQIDRNHPPETVIWEFPIRYLSDPDLFAGDQRGSG